MPDPLRPLLALLVSATPLAAQLGDIEFPTSAREPAAQEAFVEGVLLLHSFEYEDAREAFVRARQIEPGLAMATWGEALTFWHPIWKREEPGLARDALSKLAGSRSERLSLAGSDVERAWLDSVEVLFGDGTREARWTGYSQHLATMHERHPHDVEIAAMYALSVLGTSLGGRDTRTYMRAAGVAQPFFRKHPDHPGLLHYLIHCYDDPIHAPLGLEMARRYDRIAPDAGHALHMPSHIYVALGMWEASNRANEASFAAGDRRRERKQLGVDDRNWHACQWLAYGYLQRGRIEDAEGLLHTIVADLSDSRSLRMRSHVVVMRAAHLVDGGDASFSDVEISRDGMNRALVAADSYVQASAALARDDLSSARAVLSALRARSPVDVEQVAPRGGATCCAPSGHRPETVDDQLATLVVVHQIESRIAEHEGRSDDAVVHARAACDAEDRMDLDFGPPVVAHPAHELLGELLLRRGESALAIPEFEAALERAPGRARSLLGLARAHREAGDPSSAAAAARHLESIWRIADDDVRGLDEVRELASTSEATQRPAPPSRGPGSGR